MHDRQVRRTSRATRGTYHGRRVRGRWDDILKNAGADCVRFEKRFTVRAARRNARALVRAEVDTNRDGRPDQWETYQAGGLKTAAMDENGDGRPDRLLTYAGGALVQIESEPDATGTFQKRVIVK